MSVVDGLERKNTTVQTQTYEHLCYEIDMSEKEGTTEYRHTAGGISQTMASKSQTRPLRIKMRSVNLEHHNKNRSHRTWFRRTRSKPIAPDPKCRRNKPMSMMRSNAMSANSEPIILDVRIPGLDMMHMSLSSDQKRRTYGWWMPVSLVDPK